MATDGAPGRYDHLTGQQGQELNGTFLRQELARLQGQNQFLQNELMNRAVPTLANLNDALKGMIVIASTGNEVALNNLRIFIELVDQAREIVNTKGKILVAKG